MGRSAAQTLIWLTIIALVIFIIGGLRSLAQSTPTSSALASQQQTAAQPQDTGGSASAGDGQRPVAPGNQSGSVNQSSGNDQSANTQVTTTSPPVGQRDETGKGNTVSLSLSLGPGDALIGQAFGFQNATGGCQVFAVNGPYTGTVTITDGEWWTYTNGDVTSPWEQELISQLEQKQTAYACGSSNVTVLP